MASEILAQAELSSLLARYAPEKVTILRAASTHTLYRLTCQPRSYILKWCNDPSDCLEPRIYDLLDRYGVATLDVHARTDRALVLEDLQTSTAWRLADPSDTSLAATGEALAEWYRDLHRAGREALNDPGWPEYGVHPWVGAITLEALARAGAVFKLASLSAWQAAIDRAPALIEKYLALPQTFNYNDFAAENLALSRRARQPLRAIVFDYDCFATGVVYSDWRNVMAALQGAAREAFEAGYGPVAAEERCLDQPLATLYGLVIASQRSTIPAWAGPLVDKAINGMA